MTNPSYDELTHFWIVLALQQFTLISLRLRRGKAAGTISALAPRNETTATSSLLSTEDSNNAAAAPLTVRILPNGQPRQARAILAIDANF
jgi:hypothetical protein